MLPLAQKIAFLVFAAITLAGGAWGFWRLYRRIARGRVDADLRWDRMGARVWYALTTTLLQTRTFKKRPWVSFFHSFIFYGFTFYILVNFVDAVEGYFPVAVSSGIWWGAAYNLFADVLSALVLVGVVALVVRRFLLPSKKDFRFNERTLLHEDVKRRYITRDSVIVSGFILFHVGSRAVLVLGRSWRWRGRIGFSRLHRCCRTCLHRRTLKRGMCLGTGGRWGVCCCF